MARVATRKTGRGYFAIGIEAGKSKDNIGTLWRSAHNFGAAFVFTVGARYKRQASDTTRAWKHLPLFHYADLADLWAHIPHDCMVVGVELDERAQPLPDFAHPERCIYLLGAEDNGLSSEARRRAHRLIVVPGVGSLNVASVGSIVLYDRASKRPAKSEGVRVKAVA